MTVNEVKKAIANWPGIEIDGKIKARTVDFTDLARCKKTFLEVKFVRPPAPEVMAEITAFCKEAGVILSNHQVWFTPNTDD